MIKKGIRFIQVALISLFFLSIPVTNFPYFPPSFGGNTAYVKPLLVFPLLGLVILVTLPRMFTKPLPRPAVLLIIFFIWSLVASLVPLLRMTQSPWREVRLLPREIRTIITLGLACAVYFTTALYPQKKSDLSWVMRWLYIGLGVVLLWGALQAIYVLDLIPDWYELMSKAQQFIASRKLNPKRVSGMTFEPSSFADQIVTIWLPWVYAAFLTDYTVFTWRWKWLTIEKILFGWTLGILAATLSRTGLFMGVGVVVFGILLHFSREWISGREQTGPDVQDQDQSGRTFLQRNWKIALLVAAGVAVFVGLFVFIGSGSGYISRMWNYWFANSDRNLGEYLLFIGFGSRITYWKTAFRIFQAHPIFGVGLGNFTIFFPDWIPPQQLIKTPQLLRHLVPAAGRSRVITSKQFAVRILAETGLVGGAIFAVFLLTLAAGALYLWLSKDHSEKFWGTGSLLGLVAFAGVTFSFDSFAIPSPWILFGLITASFSVFRQGGHNGQSSPIPADQDPEKPQE